MTEQSSLLDEVRNMLLNSPLLANFSPAEILSAARFFTLNHVEQETVIFKEGEKGTYMCLIIEGNISVQKTNLEGEHIELAILPKGRTIGEMAVLDGERRSATCIAATDCTLLILSQDSLDKMLLEIPYIAAKVIRAIAVSLSRRLRMADGKIVDYQIYGKMVDFQI